MIVASFKNPLQFYVFARNAFFVNVIGLEMSTR